MEIEMNDMKMEAWIEDSVDAPAAVVSREYLIPVEGRDGIFFPPTFAAAENSREFPGGYNINDFGGGDNVCLVDSVGSQANRIEPMFSTGEYASLVPQLVVVAGERTVSILEAGHRAGDAIVRCTELRDALQKAFQALKMGNAVPLAKLAPTSLVFGVWDSRDTQAKAPRLLSASIRAYNVERLTRSAQYNPAVDYVEEGLLEETDDRGSLNAYSERGFRHVPASATHGGVIAKGDIRREVTLQLAALRLLRGANDDETRRLRAYLLGLALVAFTKPAVGYLRQGCNLVLDGDRKPESKVVFPDGRREAFGLTHESALAFAKKAAVNFGVGESRTVKFDTKLAKDDTASEGKKRKSAKKAKGE
jgi:CRISPR-associated protein Csb1